MATFHRLPPHIDVSFEVSASLAEYVYKCNQLCLCHMFKPPSCQPAVCCCVVVAAAYTNRRSRPGLPD